jgi:hypothetical protein
VVRPGEVNHLKHKHLSVVVARVSEGDRQSDLPEGDGLLAQDHSIEGMWATLELVSSEPQPLKRVKVHMVEATATIHEGFGEVDGGGSFHPWPCVNVVGSTLRRGLLAHRQARRDVEPPAAQHQSAECGPALAPPPNRLVVEWGGAPSLDGVPRSAP